MISCQCKESRQGHAWRATQAEEDKDGQNMRAQQKPWRLLPDKEFIKIKGQREWSEWNNFAVVGFGGSVFLLVLFRSMLLAHKKCGIIWA